MAESNTKKAKRGGRICAAPNCHNRTYNSTVSMFRFPKDKQRCKQWVINTRRADLEKYSTEQLYNGYTLCANHFEDSQFMNPQAKKSLIHTALPTLFDVPNPPPKLAMKRPPPKERITIAPPVSRPKYDSSLKNEKEESTTVLSTNQEPSIPLEIPAAPVARPPDTPRKMNMKRKIKVLSTKLNREKKKKSNKNIKLNCALECVKQYLPPKTHSFISSQIKMSRKKSKHGYRWKVEDKMLALSIFFHSRKVYKVLSRLFILPCEGTLLRDLRKMNINPGFSDSVLEALSMKVKAMDEMNCNVAIAFDEMSIKQGLMYNPGTDRVEGFEDFGDIGQTKYIANHTTVFMVRGLASKWKQPIGYFLSSGPVKSSILATLTKTCIEKVDKTGLNVVALVCDQGSNNRSFLQNKEKVAVNKPFLNIGTKKVFVFYESPHLLKNVRNNLKKGGFVIDGKLISWQHIVDFYNFDKRNRICLAPKLRDKHINLPPFSSMRVNLAAQILSHSVAAGISCLVTCKQMAEEAIYTAQFVEHFDNLFNTFNSRTLRSSQKLGNAFHDSSGHHAFLRESLAYLDKIRTLDGNELPCIQGWKMNINALLGLWHYLKSEKNFKFILTNRLNQDCVENLFSILRGRGGHRDNPDAQQLRGAFKFVVADKLFVQNTGSNCIADNDKILLDVSSIAMAKYVKPLPEDVAPPSNMDMIMLVEPPLSICEENVAAYLSGYLLRKITLDCNSCSEQLILPQLPAPFDELSVYTFLRNKTYREEGCLIYPTLAMLHFVESLEQIFNTRFESIIGTPGILATLCKSADREARFLNCVKESCILKLQAMIKLYMKVRIHHAIKMPNAQIGEDKTAKRNRKMLKLSHL